MRELNFEGLCNHTATLSSMIRECLAQEQKKANSARCKEPQWGRIVSYCEYAFGIITTIEEVQEMAHTYNWGV